MNQTRTQINSALSRDFNHAARTPTDGANNPPSKGEKSPRITLRLTAEENAQLRSLAAGVTLSAYVREALFGKEANLRKSRQRHKPVADGQALAKVLAMLGETRMANNLNQLAHRANMGELRMSADTLAKIEEAYAEIQSMRATLIKAIGLIDPS